METQTSKPKALNIVRIAADACVYNSPQNADTRAGITLRPNDDAELQITLLNKKRVIDAADIAAVKLEIFDIGDTNAPEPRTELMLLSKEVAQDGINAELDDQSYAEGGFHAAILLSSAETEFSQGAKWMKICAFTTDGMRTTFAQGWIQIDRSVGDTPSSPQGREIFLRSENNLNEIESVDAARLNLGAISADEVDVKIASALADYTPNASSESLRALSLEAVRNGGVFLRNAKVYVQNSESAFAHLPLSLCITYSVEDWGSVGSDANGISFFNKLHNPTVRYYSGFRLSYENKGGVKKLVLDVGNPISPPERNMRAEFGLTEIGGALPTGRHSVVCIIGGEISGGFVDVKMFLDNTSLPLLSRTGRGLESVYLGDDVALQANTMQLKAVNEIQAAQKRITLSRIKIFNFDISSSYGGYGVEEYAAGNEEPLMLRKRRDIFRNGLKEFDSKEWDPRRYPAASLVSSESGLIGTASAEIPSFSCMQILGQNFYAGDIVEINAGACEFGGGLSGVLSVEFLTEIEQTAQSVIIPSGGTRAYVELNESAKYLCITFEPQGNMTAEQSFTISKLHIKNLCAEISLNDAAEGVQLRDASGNNLHGALIGDYLPAKAADTFSSFGFLEWHISAETKTAFSYDCSVPKNCMLSVYARADSAIGATFGNETSGAYYGESEELQPGVWTKICEDKANGTATKITATPASDFSGAIQIAVFGKRFF